METTNPLQVLVSLIFVLALIGLIFVVYKRFMLGKNFIKGGKPRRLIVEEQLYLDAKRKLVLVKKDQMEFLLMLGINGETVINAESNYDAELPAIVPVKKRVSTKTGYPRKKS